MTVLDYLYQFILTLKFNTLKFNTLKFNTLKFNSQVVAKISDQQ